MDFWNSFVFGFGAKLGAFVADIALGVGFLAVLFGAVAIAAFLGRR
jgi:hypothetical protein